MMTSLRASVCLNNIGVLLLEKGCPHQAIATFTDAITIIKNIFSFAALGRAPTEYVDSTNQLLRKAYGRLAKSNCCSVCQHALSVCAVSFDTCPSGFVRQATSAEEPDENHRFILVRIDRPDYVSTDIEVEPDLEASVMLYNLAVAYRVAAAIACRRCCLDTAEKNSENSCRIFDMASSILARESVAGYQMASKLLIEILIMHNLRQVQASGATGNSEDFSFYATMLENLCLTFGTLVPHSTQVAPAA